MAKRIRFKTKGAARKIAVKEIKESIGMCYIDSESLVRRYTEVRTPYISINTCLL